MLALLPVISFLAPFLGLGGLSEGAKKLISIAMLVGVVVAGYAFWHHKVFDDGREYERGLIAAQDTQAIERTTVKMGEWERCRASGKEWDRLAIRCKP